jgi:hypothetical protein
MHLVEPVLPFTKLVKIKKCEGKTNITWFFLVTLVTTNIIFSRQIIK